MKHSRLRIVKGFTIVEIIIATVLIGLLAAISYVAYAGIQERSAATAVQDSLRIGGELLEINYTRNRDYPPNLAGTDYIATEGVETVLYTNAPFIRVHESLTGHQNAQLLLNVCRANMPLYIGGELYNTGCQFAGNNFHIKGQKASNTVLKGPTIHENEFEIDCPSEVMATCQTVANNIMQQFAAQGGTWPVEIPKGGKETSIPEPEGIELDSTGSATAYCLEGRYDRFPEITIGHIKTGDSAPQDGPCPDDPDLRYFPPDELPVEN